MWRVGSAAAETLRVNSLPTSAAAAAASAAAAAVVGACRPRDERAGKEMLTLSAAAARKAGGKIG